MTDLESRVLLHLTRILYPPVSKLLLQPALQAIQLAKENRFDEIIQMPGRGNLSVQMIVEGLLLDKFVNPPEEYVYTEPVQRDFKMESKLKKTWMFATLLIRFHFPWQRQ